MKNRKTFIRFFTIADYLEEEKWLEKQHENGWKLVKMVVPCFFVFEKCTPEKVSYRLDYKNNSETKDYFQILDDYGWEYIGRCIGWLYFRKPVSQEDSIQDNELFSDNESKLELIHHVMKTRLLPLSIILLCCVIPNFINCIEREEMVLVVVFSLLLILYLFLIIYCTMKLNKLKHEIK